MAGGGGTGEEKKKRKMRMRREAERLEVLTVSAALWGEAAESCGHYKLFNP